MFSPFKDVLLFWICHFMDILRIHCNITRIFYDFLFSLWINFIIIWKQFLIHLLLKESFCSFPICHFSIRNVSKLVISCRTSQNISCRSKDFGNFVEILLADKSLKKNHLLDKYIMSHRGIQCNGIKNFIRFSPSPLKKMRISCIL